MRELIEIECLQCGVKFELPVSAVDDLSSVHCVDCGSDRILTFYEKVKTKKDEEEVDELESMPLEKLLKNILISQVKLLRRMDVLIERIEAEVDSDSEDDPEVH